MKSNSWVGLVGVLAALAALPSYPAGARPADEKDKASVWMTKKLEFSQKILAGLTKGDFEAVRKNADSMIVVGYLERWDRADIPEYKRQLKAFEEANKDLVRRAERKDVGGATKAYAKLVVSCVECHTVVRDAKR